jgi:hypothetical protein
MDSEHVGKWAMGVGSVLFLALIVVSVIEGWHWLVYGELPDWTLSAVVNVPVTRFVGLNKLVDGLLHLQILWLWVPFAWLDRVWKKIAKNRFDREWREKVQRRLGGW